MMRDLLLSIVLLASLKFLFEEARQSSWVVRVVHAFFYGGVILFAHFKAQHMSLPQLEALLDTPEALKNIALFVMLDLILAVYVATTSLGRGVSQSAYLKELPMGTAIPGELPTPPANIAFRIEGVIRRIPLFFPPLLFIPALFYVRLTLFYSFTGYSFLNVTFAMIGIAVILVLVAPYLLLPFTGRSREAQSSASIFTSFITFLLVVGAGVLHASSRIYVESGVALPNWLEMGVMLLILLVGALVGYIIFLLAPRLRRLSKNKNCNTPLHRKV